MHLHANLDRSPNGYVTPTNDRHAAMWLRTGLAVLFAALPIAGACSSNAPTVKVAEPVGPSPTSPSFFDQGRLLIHTDLSGDRYNGSGYPTPEQSARAPYKIYNLDGYEIRTIDNDGTNTDPEVVTLGQGEYLVRAKGLGGKLVDVKVRVERGKTTEVFLDGSRPPADIASDSLVRTSDGTVIGWRAAPKNTAIGGGPREGREGFPRFKSMSARIGDAMCDHAMRCGQIGANEKYATRAQCVSKVHSAKRSEYPHSSCVEVSQVGFKDCISAIRAEECRVELDSPADLAACRTENVCRK